MEPTDLYALLQFHKQEAAEGMAYINAYSAAVLGILAYLGVVKHITIVARISLAFSFIVLPAVGLMALIDSNAMHQAIHVEIGKVVKENSELIKSEDLLKQLEDLKSPSPGMIKALYAFFSVIVVGAILLIGEGNALNIFKRLKSQKK